MKQTLSRRQLIFAGGATLIAPELSARDLRTAENAAGLSSKGRRVSAISGEDDQFGSAVENKFPGLSSDTTFRVIKPLAMLITLEEGPGIRAYSLAWSVTTASGTYSIAKFYYHAPGSRAKQKSTSTLASARANLLTVGDSVLVTPFFNWNPEDYAANRAPDWNALISYKEPGDFLVSQLAAAASTSVSLDCVVFSDWKSLGSDTKKLANRLNIRRNAEHDEALAVHKMLRKGASDSAVSAMLTSHGFSSRTTASKRGQRLYEQARRFHAQVLLRHFLDADRRTFLRALHRLIKQPKTHVVAAGV